MAGDAMRKLLAGLSLLTAAGAAHAQLTVTTTRQLQFGSFATSASGTLTISPAGLRSATGGVYPLSGAAGASASFTISDTDPANQNRSFIISLPDDSSVTLSNGGGATMQAGAFVSAPSGSALLTGSSQPLTVGATLTVHAGQATGVYTGAFSVTINYQ